MKTKPWPASLPPLDAVLRELPPTGITSADLRDIYREHIPDGYKFGIFSVTNLARRLLSDRIIEPESGDREPWRLAPARNQTGEQVATAAEIRAACEALEIEPDELLARLFPEVVRADSLAPPEAKDTPLAPWTEADNEAAAKAEREEIMKRLGITDPDSPDIEAIRLRKLTVEEAKAKRKHQPAPAPSAPEADEYPDV